MPGWLGPRLSFWVHLIPRLPHPTPTFIFPFVLKHSISVSQLPAFAVAVPAAQDSFLSLNYMSGFFLSSISEMSPLGKGCHQATWHSHPVALSHYPILKLIFSCPFVVVVSVLCLILLIMKYAGASAYLFHYCWSQNMLPINIFQMIV